MNRVAWLTYALLALAHGRIYERCELARELLALGVEPDDIATWVCIAFHESRFNTSAKNPYSGDHGIFQISELYWCGPDKACHLPCSKLRDEDISNDLQCARQIHEEHTRLQGDGFLAWVVYPQHCKYNTKKYLVDCDISVKTSVPITQSRVFMYENRYFPNYNNQPKNVETLMPSYLTIGNIIRENYSKILDLDKKKVDWYNYKINNIDDLKLLTSFIKPSHQAIDFVTPVTIKETTEYFPPVVPWRTVETNQFRHNKILPVETTTKIITGKTHASRTLKDTTTQSPTMTTEEVTSTRVPMTSKASSTIYNTILNTQPTTENPTAATYTIRDAIPYRIIYRWRPTTSTTPSTPTSTKALLSYNPRVMPVVSTSERPPNLTTKPLMALTKFTTTTVRTPTTKYTPRSIEPVVTRTTLATIRTTAHSTSTLSTTALPPSVLPIDRSPTRTTAYETITGTKSTTTIKPKTDYPRYTFTSRTASTTAATTTKLYPRKSKTLPLSHSTTSTTRQIVPTTTTQKPYLTQSVFDLYLNPTKPPKLQFTRLVLMGQNVIRVKIFANGTTTLPPSQIKQSTKEPQGMKLNDKIDMP